VKEVGFKPRQEWHSEGVIDGESGEPAEEEDVAGVGTGESEIKRLEWGWRREARVADPRGKVKHVEMNDQLRMKEERNAKKMLKDVAAIIVV